MNYLHNASDEVAAVFIDHREKHLSSAHRAQTASEPSNGSTEIRPVQMTENETVAELAETRRA